MRLELTFSQDATADPNARTITGVVVPYGVPSKPTQNGHRYRFYGPPSNADELIDVVREHDDDAVVGRLRAWKPADGHLAAAVRAFTTSAGNDALVEASEQVRTGFSVGADATTLEPADDGVYDVREWTARHIGLVRRPAFTDSTITSVAAAAADDDPPADDEEADAALEDDPPAHDVTVDGVSYVPEGSTEEATDEEEPTMATTAAPPVELSRGGRRRPELTFARVRDQLADAFRRSSDAAFVNAALSDIIPAGDAGAGLLRPQWLDELWTPVASRRDYIESINRQALTTGTKVYGWKWKTTPVVGPYAGNKTDIPSGPVDTEPAEAPITRLAGGWDIDRIYFDLGNPGFLEALFRSATVSVGKQQEALVSTELQAEATDKTATNVLEALNVISTTLSEVGASVSFIGVASDLWAQFLSVTTSDAPWWLPQTGNVSLADSTGGAGGLRFFVDPNLPAGHVLGGDRNAATYFEASPNPLRVQAVNVPKAGIDVSVLSYQAILVNDARGLVDVSVATLPLAAARSTSK